MTKATGWHSLTGKELRFISAQKKIISAQKKSDTSKEKKNIRGETMEEADRLLCEKCGAVNYADAEFCRRCGEPLQPDAPMPAPRQPEIVQYEASAELPEPPRNALDELMHLGIGGLIGFGIRLGFALAIAEIIALMVIVIILIVVVIVLTLLGVGIGNLFFGNLASLARV